MQSTLSYWRLGIRAHVATALAAFAAIAAGPSSSAEQVIVASYSRPNQACGRMICDCPGCRAYFEACDLPCPTDAWEGGAPSSQTPETMDGAEATPESVVEPSAEPLSGPMPSAAAMGATAVAMSATPHMIGDLFGVNLGGSQVLLDRLFVIGTDIEALVPAPSGSPFTASESPSAVAIAEAFDRSGATIAPQGVVAVQPSAAEFTTAVPVEEMAAALNANPNADIPIVNNSGYQGLAEAELAARNGSGGSTQFNSGASFAQMQDSVLPSGVPGDGEDYDAVYAYDYVVEAPIDAPGGAPGAMVGRQKMAENGSSLPRDRVINNFSFFNNTPLLATGKDVTRNVVGFEKTFFDGMTSLELRAPFASTLDSNLALGPTGAIGGTNGEFGNMTLYAKLLLLQNRRYAVGAGLGIAMPTADDFVIHDAVGTEVLRIENESSHLLPYLGLVLTPNANLFWQGFVQVDVDTRGNGASVSTFANGAYTGQLEFVDRLHDKDLIYVDMAMGYWLFQNSRQASFATGLAPIVELHYNGSIDAGDALTTDTIRTVSDSSFDLVNAVVGAVMQFGRSTNLSLGYAAPLGGDEQFDGEFRMNLNWYFGPSARRYARNPL